MCVLSLFDCSPAERHDFRLRITRGKCRKGERRNHHGKNYLFRDSSSGTISFQYKGSVEFTHLVGFEVPMQKRLLAVVISLDVKEKKIA